MILEHLWRCGEYGGTVEGAIAALEQFNDPEAAACVVALKERKAERMHAAA